jgi:hypothetical protein
VGDRERDFFKIPPGRQFLKSGLVCSSTFIFVAITKELKELMETTAWT